MYSHWSCNDLSVMLTIFCSNIQRAEKTFATLPFHVIGNGFVDIHVGLHQFIWGGVYLSSEVDPEIVGREMGYQWISGPQRSSMEASFTEYFRVSYTEVSVSDTTVNFACSFPTLTFWICKNQPAVLTDAKGMHSTHPIDSPLIWVQYFSTVVYKVFCVSCKNLTVWFQKTRLSNTGITRVNKS